MCCNMVGLMASIVSICNLALTNLGKENISALSEPGPEARACNQFYAHVRDLLLQSYPWRFAGKTLSLAQIENDKPGAWGFAYTRPVDCLKVRWLRSQYSLVDPSPLSLQDEITTPFDIEGRNIYANLSPAFLRYTRSMEDPSAFSPLFVEALAWHLTVRLAMPLTRDPKVRADAYQLAGRAESAAAQADANEVRETSDHESDFVRGRE